MHEFEQINQILREAMQNSRNKIIAVDKIYQASIKKEEKLKKQYRNLKINKRQKKILNDYIEYIQINRSHYADISYIVGMKDAVDALCNLGLITDFDTHQNN